MSTTTWLYLQSEYGAYPLWTVGFYDPDGKWIAESDHGRANDAAERVHYLNGGGRHRMANQIETIPGAYTADGS